MKRYSTAHAVRRYFDSQAEHYQSDSERFPWSALRSFEARAFLGAIGPVRGKNVLELGSGAGYYTRLMVNHGASRLHAVDISPRMMDAFDHPQIEKYCGDAATVKIDQVFPVIISAGLLEFVSDPLVVLRNARAHSTQNGRLTILFPRRCLAGDAYRAMHHRKNGLPIRLFHSGEMANIARQAGWIKEYESNCALFSCVMRLHAAE